MTRIAAVTALILALTGCVHDEEDARSDPNIRLVTTLAAKKRERYTCAVTDERSPIHLASEAPHIGICVGETKERRNDHQTVDCNLHRANGAYADNIEIHSWHEDLEEPVSLDTWEEPACARAARKVRPWVEAEIDRISD